MICRSGFLARRQLCRACSTPPRPPEDLDPEDTARRLGRFVRDLQAADTSGAPVANDHTQRAGSLTAFDETARGALEDVVALMASGRIGSDLFAAGAARDLWQAVVDAPEWDGVGVWLHRDLYLGNLLAADRRLTGVVDFGGLAVGDPAGDPRPRGTCSHRDTGTRS